MAIPIACVSTTAAQTLLAKEDGPAAELLRPNGAAPVCLVCEHASAYIPASLGHLGVAPEHRESHAAWDIGARALSVALSEALDAPLVMSRVSRLVYDCNRPPSAKGAMPERSEIVDIPGNVDLSEAARTARTQEVYEPFRSLLSKKLNGFDQPAALVTIHSFTPVWFGQPRDVQIGLLHDTDDGLAKRMCSAASTKYDTRLNAPYAATDGVTHTLKEHAIPRGLQNVMIEIRNDLLRDPGGVSEIAKTLVQMLNTALTEGATA